MTRPVKLTVSLETPGGQIQGAAVAVQIDAGTVLVQTGLRVAMPPETRESIAGPPVDSPFVDNYYADEHVIFLEAVPDDPEVHRTIRFSEARQNSAEPHHRICGQRLGRRTNARTLAIACLITTFLFGAIGVLCLLLAH